MIWLNEYEVDDAVRRFDNDDTPNLGAGAHTLRNLMHWTNHNSDGWPYWQPPAKAAAKLMALLSGVDRFDPVDVTAAELRAAVSPIKAFRTKANKGGKWGIRGVGTADFRVYGDQAQVGAP